MVRRSSAARITYYVKREHLQQWKIDVVFTDPLSDVPLRIQRVDYALVKETMGLLYSLRIFSTANVL